LFNVEAGEQVYQIFNEGGFYADGFEEVPEGFEIEFMGFSALCGVVFVIDYS
jgi:hypothetical protein